MKKLYLIGLAAVFAGGMVIAREPTMREVERQFRELPMEARRLTGPLFWLHGDETREQLEQELRNVVEGGNGIFTAESRPHQDWLGEGWYRDLEICLQFARSNNLAMIIFDDWWWPSQMMGGRVPPQYGSKRLEATAAAFEGPQTLRAAGYDDPNLIAVVAGRVVEGGAVDGATLVNLTASIKEGALAWEMPAGQWQVMKFTWQYNGAKGDQRRYISVDGASPDAVDWFIENVYQTHYERFKADFGKTIVGFFYDEPETQGDWGSDLPVLIAERGLDLAKLLVGYKFKLAGEEQSAAFQTYLDAFADSWGRTMYGGLSKWCKARNVYSMGHFMEHGNCIFSRGMSGGNMMQLQAHSDMGGIDLVCNQLYPGQRPMGMYQMPKIASSISHTFNKAGDIAMCEIYGGYNQSLTYPQMKWLADWHHVRGVNMLITHSFNPRAPYDNDYPPYFNNGGFEPRWPLYRVWADYTSRLSLLLTGGRHVCPVALLHIGQSVHTGRSIRPEELTSTMQDALYDCDWLNYESFEQDATLAGAAIKLHKEEYQILIVPPVEVIPYPSLQRAKEFFDNGGVVVGYGFLPTKSATLGKSSAEIDALRAAIWGADPAVGTEACNKSAQGGRAYFLPEKPSVAEITAAFRQDAGIVPTLQVVEGETGNWLHVLHRVKSGCDLFLVCNQNHEGAARPFKLRVTAAGEPECWDAMRNTVTALPYKRLAANQVEVTLTLEPSESVVLLFQREKRALPLRLEPGAKPMRAPINIVRAPTPPELVIPSAPSATLDSAPDKLEQALSGCDWIWGQDGNAAHSAPPGPRYFRGSCTVDAVRKIKQARFIGTCDNMFTLFVNGQQAGMSSEAIEGWRKPATIDVTGQLVGGANTLAVAAVNLTDKPSPAGLIGQLEVTFEQGEPQRFNLDATWKSSDQRQDNWNQPQFNDADWPAAKSLGKYGCAPWGQFASLKKPKVNVSPVTSDPFVGHCELPAEMNLAQVRVLLEMDEIEPEAAARVTINGQDAGGFIGKPLQLEVTKHLKPGTNTVVIEPFAPKSARLTVWPK
ncbi:MAG: glycosyl hydrolase [Kiritimatiellae bacterium]|nr:glycosyl hydrolase [Kiritimatiellia bacterium]